MSVFALRSSAFADGGRIPERHTADGDEVSPPLAWTDVPSGTRELTLLCEDVDVPIGGSFTHMILYSIPPGTVGLPEALPATERLPDGTVQGVGGFRRVGYRGPAPVGRKPHRYRFRLFALDGPLGLGPGVNTKRLMKAMSGHVIAVAQLTGIYSR